MAFGAFQISGFQRNAFQIATVVGPAPTPFGTKGGYKKERTHNKSFRQTVKESLHELLDEPKVIEQIKELVQPYSNSKHLTTSSVDFKLLARNVEAAERIINLAIEMQKEREDEEAILLLM
jgi:hypothetical protein